MSGTEPLGGPSWSRWLARERARPQRIRTWPQAWKLSVAVVCFGAFMGQLDASVVTLVYRPVGTEFHAGLAAVEWVSLAYLVTLVASLIPVGRFSDAHGRKLLYLHGFVVFVVASAACGLAPSLFLLIVFRVVQALGAALLQANSVALVATAAPADRTRHALGVQAGAQAVGLALGPSVGGILVATLGWRWVFFVNVPVGLVAVTAGHYLLPRTRERTSITGVDWPSAGIVAVSTTSLLLCMSAGSGLAVPGEVAVALFVLAGLGARWFVSRQHRVAHPLVDTTLLTDRAVSWGLVGALSGYLVLFGPLVLIPVVLIAHGVSPLGAGLVLTALPTGFAVAAIGAGRILPRSLSEHFRAALGAMICTVALGAGTVLPLDAATLVPLLAVIGVGLGVFAPSNNTMIMTAVPAGASATGGGLINLARGLGTALGVAAVTLALHLGSGWTGPLSDDRLAIIVLLISSVVATFASLAARKKTSPRAPPGSSPLFGVSEPGPNGSSASTRPASATDR
jgi:MFS family permease